MGKIPRTEYIIILRAASIFLLPIFVNLAQSMTGRQTRNVSAARVNCDSHLVSALKPVFSYEPVDHSSTVNAYNIDRSGSLRIAS